ncbi:MAG: hypothetical protein WDW36_008843 [Sanguina aurantia]
METPVAGGISVRSSGADATVPAGSAAPLPGHEPSALHTPRSRVADQSLTSLATQSVSGGQGSASAVKRARLSSSGAGVQAEARRSSGGSSSRPSTAAAKASVPSTQPPHVSHQSNPLSLAAALHGKATAPVHNMFSRSHVSHDGQGTVKPTVAAAVVLEDAPLRVAVTAPPAASVAVLADRFACTAKSRHVDPSDDAATYAAAAAATASASLLEAEITSQQTPCSSTIRQIQIHVGAPHAAPRQPPVAPASFPHSPSHSSYHSLDHSPSMMMTPGMSIGGWGGMSAWGAGGGVAAGGMQDNPLCGMGLAMSPPSSAGSVSFMGLGRRGTGDGCDREGGDGAGQSHAHTVGQALLDASQVEHSGEVGSRSTHALEQRRRRQPQPQQQGGQAPSLCGALQGGASSSGRHGFVGGAATRRPVEVAGVGDQSSGAKQPPPQPRPVHSAPGEAGSAAQMPDGGSSRADGAVHPLRLGAHQASDTSEQPPAMPHHPPGDPTASEPPVRHGVLHAPPPVVRSSSLRAPSGASHSIASGIPLPPSIACPRPQTPTEPSHLPAAHGDPVASRAPSEQQLKQHPSLDTAAAAGVAAGSTIPAERDTMSRYDKPMKLAHRADRLGDSSRAARDSASHDDIVSLWAKKPAALTASASRAPHAHSQPSHAHAAAATTHTGGSMRAAAVPQGRARGGVSQGDGRAHQVVLPGAGPAVTGHDPTTAAGGGHARGSSCSGLGPAGAGKLVAGNAGRGRGWNR